MGASERTKKTKLIIHYNVNIHKKERYTTLSGLSVYMFARSSESISSHMGPIADFVVASARSIFSLSMAVMRLRRHL
jgi:hypothetical protein